MRAIIVNILLYFGLGIVTAVAGMTVRTWEFWVCMLLIGGIQLNTSGLKIGAEHGK